MLQNRIKSSSLLITTTFLSGIATVFNMPGNFYNYNQDLFDEETDLSAIENDWIAIRQDFQDVIKNNPPSSFTFTEIKPTNNKLVSTT